MENEKNMPENPANEHTENQDTQANQPDKEDTPKKKKGGIHNNAIYAASMGRSAVGHVDPHSNRGLADTGTNISYEGPTAPGSGGSVGSGYSSGRSAADPEHRTESEYDKARIERKSDSNSDDRAEKRKGDTTKDNL